MAGSEYILDNKARKELCCRLPRLLKDGKTASAHRLLEKHRATDNSPILHACRIMVAEASGAELETGGLFAASEAILKRAARRGASEVPDFFLRLFSFYVGAGELEKAEAVFEMGKRHNVDRSDYGMLWVRFCDRADRCREGLESMEAYLCGKKRLSEREIDVLRSQYPTLAQSEGFDLILRR